MGEAAELKRRFNEVFWIEADDYFALGLDANKRPIRSIASDQALCLVTGIVDEPHVDRVVARVMGDELFSGWGVRTLSRRHPAYDPFAYHRGTVWPVLNGLIALGLARYRRFDALHVLCKGQIETAALFEHFRLPECISGHPRDDAHPIPALYPDANWPQAWSSASMFALLQALLGLEPDAPRARLALDPALPDWLPHVIVRNLRVGSAVVTLELVRGAGGSSPGTARLVFACALALARGK